MLRSALLILTLCAPAATQSVQVLVEGNARHGDIVTGPRGVVLPAGEFTVAELLEATAGYLCRNYLYDPNVVLQRPPFRLQRELALDATGAEEVLCALLSTRDLAALPLDELRGVYQVVALDPRAESHPMSAIPWRRPQDLLRRPRLRELALTVVPVEHADARVVAAGLRSHFAMQRQWQPGAPTVSHVGPRSLVLHGYADQLAQTVQAVAALDQMAAPRAAAPADAQLLERLEQLEREVAALKQRLRGRE